MLRFNVMWLLLLICPALALDSLEVETPLGKVLGKDYGGFLAFKGVPYSEPPQRFEAPHAKLPWTGTWNGTKFGNSCIHGFSHHDPDPLESYVESEDCLYANVWVPKGKELQPLPVVVFIHGGGFVRNSGATPNFWGDAFVTNEEAPAILVTFNYRLGIFGFFSWNGTAANVGFQDQQLLLRWVQQNIRAFGVILTKCFWWGKVQALCLSFVMLLPPALPVCSTVPWPIHQLASTTEIDQKMMSLYVRWLTACYALEMWPFASKNGRQKLYEM